MTPQIIDLLEGIKVGDRAIHGYASSYEYLTVVKVHSSGLVLINDSDEYTALMVESLGFTNPENHEIFGIRDFYRLDS